MQKDNLAARCRKSTHTATELTRGSLSAIKVLCIISILKTCFIIFSKITLEKPPSLDPVQENVWKCFEPPLVPAFSRPSAVRVHLILTDPTLTVLLGMISRVNQRLMVGVNESTKRDQHIAQRSGEDILKDLNSRKVKEFSLSLARRMDDPQISLWNKIDVNVAWIRYSKVSQALLWMQAAFNLTVYSRKKLIWKAVKVLREFLFFLYRDSTCCKRIEWRIASNWPGAVQISKLNFCL